MKKTKSSSQPQRDDVTPRPLLVKRTEAGPLLGGISSSQLIRLEKAGLLKPVKLSKSPVGAVFYSYDNVLDVARGQQASLDEAGR
jgi:hypothetical protein